MERMSWSDVMVKVTVMQIVNEFLNLHVEMGRKMHEKNVMMGIDQ